MRFREFITYNVLGAFFWIWSMIGTGYFLGTYIPNIEKNIGIVIVVVVFISVLPAIISTLRARSAARRTGAAAIETQ